MAELNGAMLHDLELKIGWGKAVQLPAEPLYTAINMAAGGARTGVAVAPPGAEAAPPWADPHADEPASNGKRYFLFTFSSWSGIGREACMQMCKCAVSLFSRGAKSGK